MGQSANPELFFGMVFGEDHLFGCEDPMGDLDFGQWVLIQEGHSNPSYAEGRDKEKSLPVALDYIGYWDGYAQKALVVRGTNLGHYSYVKGLSQEHKDTLVSFDEEAGAAVLFEFAKKYGLNIEKDGYESDPIGPCWILGASYG